MSLSGGYDREQKDTHSKVSGTGEEKAGDAMEAASARTEKVL